MTKPLDHLELGEITNGNRSLAIVESIEGLGCSVFADGGELTAPWICRKVEELVNSPIQDGAVLTTQTVPQYFILKRDPEQEEFTVVRGPLTADELRPELAKSKGAGK